MAIRLKYFNEVTDDFVNLTLLLDQELDAVNGDFKDIYRQYNKLAGIDDVVIAYDSDHAIACGSFKRYDAHTFEIKRMFVERDYRRQGIARLIVERLEEAAQQKGAARLVLETGKTLHAANGLYESLGYRRIENYGQYAGMPLSVCMEKQLSAR